MTFLIRQRKGIFYAFVVLLTLFFLFVDFASSLPQTPSPSQQYLRGTVTKITAQGTREINGKDNPYQEVVISFRENNQPKEITLTHGGEKIITDEQRLTVGQDIVLAKAPDGGRETYVIWDEYRLPTIGIFVGLFFLLVFLITGKKGIGALLGLAFSFIVIMKGIIPLIMIGHDPLLISILGSVLILAVGIYLAHGLTEQTTVAVVSTFLSLVLTGVLAVFFVKLAHLSGLGSEDAATLQIRFANTINFQGLLLGGIIIGALGVLDDVTTAQAATVYELSRTDRRLGFRELVTKGMRVGREHITSLVNTLVLAYAGASISVFIYVLLSLQSGTVPLWVILNSEILVEEVVRTLAGSIGLVLAVPITTILASFLSKYSVKVT